MHAYLLTDYTKFNNIITQLDDGQVGYYYHNCEHKEYGDLKTANLDHGRNERLTRNFKPSSRLLWSEVEVDHIWPSEFEFWIELCILTCGFNMGWTLKNLLNDEGPMCATAWLIEAQGPVGKQIAWLWTSAVRCQLFKFDSLSSISNSIYDIIYFSVKHP